MATGHRITLSKDEIAHTIEGLKLHAATLVEEIHEVKPEDDMSVLVNRVEHWKIVVALQNRLQDASDRSESTGDDKPSPNVFSTRTRWDATDDPDTVDEDAKTHRP